MQEIDVPVVVTEEFAVAEPQLLEGCCCCGSAEQAFKACVKLLQAQVVKLQAFELQIGRPIPKNGLSLRAGAAFEADAVNVGTVLAKILKRIANLLPCCPSAAAIFSEDGGDVALCHRS